MTAVLRAVCLAVALSLVQGAVQARARPIVTREHAEAIALNLVRGGSILIASLEQEKGETVWSFDVSIPGSKNVKAIEVDAYTGKVVSNTVESPVDR
jgi:uncharacterized membrane protein YkoI